MKKIYRPGLMALAATVLLSVRGFAQDDSPVPPPPPAKAPKTETTAPAPPAEPVDVAEPVEAIPPVPEIIEDGDGVIVRHTGKGKSKITIEMNGGDVKINGKPINEFKDKNVSVNRVPPAITITTDDRDFSPFRQKLFKQDQLDKMQRDLDRQSREISVDVERQIEDQNRMQADRNMKLKVLVDNPVYLGVGSKKSDDAGALVFEISTGSPAEKAGLKKGDVITKVDTKLIDGPDDLYKVVHEYKAGDKVKLTFKRDGKEMNVTATLQKSKTPHTFSYNYRFNAPDVQGYRGWNRDDFDEDQPKIGLKAQDNEDGKGVDVMDVVPGSAAEKAGLKKGDIVVRYDGEDVNSAADLADRVRGTRKKSKLSVSILRDGKPQDLDLHIPHKLRTEEL